MTLAERPTGRTAGRGTTRERILVLLRRHGHLSAPRLAGLLQPPITPVGVRRHLALLERDGLITATLEKPRRGRPTAIYQLTDAGLETFPRHYDEVAREVLTFLKGKDAEVLGQFLAWRNERLAADYAERIDGATLAERAEALAELLTEQGYMAEVETRADGLRLCQHNCTVEHLASELPDLCASETALFERLLGAPVEREATIVQGAIRCVAHLAAKTAAGKRHPSTRTLAAGTTPSQTANNPSATRSHA
jgi:predicted ArsR family transcriptional regulator